jgi:glutamine cyclotransferase
VRRGIPALLLAVAIAAASCGGDDDGAPSGRSALLPAFLQNETNAQATIPRVPYSPATPRFRARATRRWPHDTLAYTQGLLVHEGRLIESAGLRSHSNLREVDRETGRVLRRTDLPVNDFAEGIAALGDRIYQLEWKSGRGYVYDARTLVPLDSFTYDGEGWGLTTDDTLLYLSDGTSRVRVIDPSGFRVLRTIRVTEAGKPVNMINELEWVDGELWANVYETTFIARIDPGTGHVVGWVDLGRLLPDSTRSRLYARDGVANGIAYDRASRQLLVTGKYWPFVFRFDSVPRARKARSRPADRERARTQSARSRRQQ